jgi:hypothetical protein
MESRARKVDAALAICAILVGFVITFGIIYAVRGRSAAPRDPSPAARRSLTQNAVDGPSPAALDAQWLDYSDHSTCADWAGGDGVSAVRLSSSQTAWFFADTYLGPAGPRIGYSHLGGFLHNSVVVQTTEHHHTSFVTLTGGGACPRPTAFGRAASVVQAPTTGQGQERYWDGDGIRVGGAVVKFYNLYQPGPFPFVAMGTTIARFSVSKLVAAGHGPRYGAVIRPKLTAVPPYTPPDGGTPIVWGSALLVSRQAGPAGQAGQTVYVYGWQSPYSSSPVQQLYLARVSAARLADFGAWQFYSAGRWVDSQDLALPVEPLIGNLDVPAGFSVVQVAGRYWLIQAPGAGDPDILAYPAPAPWGPFDNFHPIVLYRAAGIGLNVANDYRVMYEARAEPALSTARTLVISYNVNSEAITAACTSLAFFTNAISQPRFIAVPQAAFTVGADPPQRLVRAGPSSYPQITLRDPSQWYNAWSFPGGCPPVPGVSHVTAQAGPGIARLTWPSAGIGLQYQIYVAAGSGGFAQVRTVSSNHVTLTRLTHGLTYQFQVVPVNYYSNAGPGAQITVQIP